MIAGRCSRYHGKPLIWQLESKDLVMELADGAGFLVSESLGGLLHGGDHRRRSTEQDLDVISGSREMFLYPRLVSTPLQYISSEYDTNLDHISSNKANTTLPSLWRVVQNVVDVELVILSSQLVQFLLEKNILRVDIGENEIDLGSIVAAVSGSAADNSLDNLEHGSNTSSTRDHTNVAVHVGGVHHGTLGTANLHVLTDLQVIQVLGNVALRVGLDQKIKVASFMVGGDRGVGANNGGRVSSNLSLERDVLTNWETQDVRCTRKGESVDGDVVGDEVLFFEDKVLELLGIEHLSRA